MIEISSSKAKVNPVNESMEKFMLEKMRSQTLQWRHYMIPFAAAAMAAKENGARQLLRHHCHQLAHLYDVLRLQIWPPCQGAPSLAQQLADQVVWAWAWGRGGSYRSCRRLWPSWLHNAVEVFAQQKFSVASTYSVCLCWWLFGQSFLRALPSATLMVRNFSLFRWKGKVSMTRGLGYHNFSLR